MFLRRTLQALMLGNIVTLIASAASPKSHQTNTPTIKAVTDTTQFVPPRFVIFVLADDLGWGSTSQDDSQLMNMAPGVEPNVNALIATPNIKKLMQQGMRFKNAFACAPLCTPSRAALISGVPSDRSLVRDNSGNDPVPVNFPTIPQFFKSRGYYTKKIGKDGLGANGTESAPNALGYDDFYGYTSDGFSSYPYPQYLWRNTAQEWLPNNQKISAAKCTAGKCTYAGDLFLVELREFMSTLTTKSPPTYLEVALTQPHLGLYTATSQYESLIPSYGQYASNKYMTANQKGYAAMITDYVDAAVGIIMNAVASNGIAAETLIVFTSDNGGQYDPEMIKGKYTRLQPTALQANGGLSMLKYYMYNGGLQVPMTVVYPNYIPANTVSNYPVVLYDLFATFKDMFGVATASPTTKGTTQIASPVSILAILQGRKTAVPRDYFSTEYCPGNVESSCKWALFKTTTYMSGFMALVFDIDNYATATVNPALNAPQNYRLHLYNLTADPRQQEDLINNQRYSSLVATMQAVRNSNRIPLPT